jgi:hypothetical protein
MLAWLKKPICIPSFRFYFRVNQVDCPFGVVVDVSPIGAPLHDRHTSIHVRVFRYSKWTRKQNQYVHSQNLLQVVRDQFKCDIKAHQTGLLLPVY